MKRKSIRKFAEHGGQARVLAFVAFRVIRPLLVVLAWLGTVLMLPVQQVAFEKANFGAATLGMGAVAAPLTGHLDAALTNFSKGFRQNGLVSDLLFPRVPVGRQTDKYWIHGRENQQITEKVLRAPGAVPENIRLSLSTDSYFCNSHSLQAEIPAETEAAYEAGNLEQDATQDLTEKILLAKEIEAAALATDAAVITNNVTLAGGDQWSDYGNSKPGTDVEAIRSVIRQSGMESNLMIVPEAVAVKLRFHPAILEAFKYTSSDFLTDEKLATFFGIEKVVTARGVKLDQAGTATFVWGKDVVLAYVSPSAGQKDASGGKTFVWAGAPGTIGGYGVIVAPHPYASAKSKIVSADFYHHQKITAIETMGVIKAAVA